MLSPRGTDPTCKLVLFILLRASQLRPSLLTTLQESLKVSLKRHHILQSQYDADVSIGAHNDDAALLEAPLAVQPTDGGIAIRVAELRASRLDVVSVQHGAQRA